MKLPSVAVPCFTARIPEADWADYFGVDYPDTSVCIAGRLRPLSRADGHVLADCSLADSTPTKERWGKQKGRVGGPSLRDLIEREGVTIYFGARAHERHTKLPPDVAQHVHRHAVYRRDDGESLHAEVEGCPVRAKEAWAAGGAVRKRVPVSQVIEGDVPEGAPGRPYRFAGEGR